jgi:hypothetical protein
MSFNLMCKKKTYLIFNDNHSRRHHNFIGFFSFQKNFLIRNACGIESLMAADIALILLWKKKGFHLKTF